MSGTWTEGISQQIMNYLAHLHLSFDYEELMIGNFMTDLSTPSQWKAMRSEIQDGIALHHFIDKSTDSHPIFKETKAIFYKEFGHYSAVIVDIVYDHFLAKNFSQYHALNLKEFVKKFYKTVDREIKELPDRVVDYYIKLKYYRWLTAYADLYGLSEVFYGMDRRTKYRSGMSKAPDLLIEHYESIQHQFEEFYPNLMECSKEYIDTKIYTRVEV